MRDRKILERSVRRLGLLFVGSETRFAADVGDIAEFGKL